MSHQAGLGAVNQFAAHLNINYFGDQSLGNGVDVDTAPATTAATKAAPDGIDTAELAHHANLAAQNQDSHVGAGAPPLSGSRFAASSPARANIFQLATNPADLDTILGISAPEANDDLNQMRCEAIRRQFEFVVLTDGVFDAIDPTKIDLDETLRLRDMLEANRNVTLQATRQGWHFAYRKGRQIPLMVLPVFWVGLPLPPGPMSIPQIAGNPQPASSTPSSAHHSNTAERDQDLAELLMKLFNDTADLEKFLKRYVSKDITNDISFTGNRRQVCSDAVEKLVRDGLISELIDSLLNNQNGWRIDIIRFKEKYLSNS